FAAKIDQQEVVREFQQSFCGSVSGWGQGTNSQSALL
ncbi:MAG: hypothetical protein ACJAUW_000509, partial [Yoonia sp.]